MIRVLVNGARGRMGKECIRAISEEEGLELAGGVDVGDDLAKAVTETKSQVVVDFTTAGAGYKNCCIILEAGARPVIGTTGVRKDEVVELQKIASAKKIGGLVAPNFAIGAVLMMKFAQQAVKYMPHAEIIELHHDKKADSPSGTAIHTAELMLEALTERLEDKPDKALIPGARGAALDGIHIHAVRLPGLVAHQKVIFGGLAQTLTIQHDSLDRSSFMPGVCLACKKVVELDELVYGLENLL